MKPYPAMYILRCADDTAARRPIRLVYFEEFEDIQAGFKREKQVQSWSKAKREALIAGDAAALRAASKKKFAKKHKAGRNTK